MNKFKDIQWVVQKNLTNEETMQDFRKSCENLEIDFIELQVIPFTNEIPDFPQTKRSLFYGSITLNKLIYEKSHLKEGLFFNSQTFNMENYITKWGEYMLNFGAKITTFKELSEIDYEPDSVLFIRPNEDNKSFSGETKKFSEIFNWYESLSQIENADLNLNTKIIVGEPYNIKSEWRLWIVNKKVVASTKYREYFKLKKEKGCPLKVIDFAEKRCEEYTPHDVFVMDIGLSGNEY